MTNETSREGATGSHSRLVKPIELTLWVSGRSKKSVFNGNGRRGRFVETPVPCSPSHEGPKSSDRPIPHRRCLQKREHLPLRIDSYPASLPLCQQSLGILARTKVFQLPHPLVLSKGATRKTWYLSFSSSRLAKLELVDSSPHSTYVSSARRQQTIGPKPCSCPPSRTVFPTKP
jgi:hypothetical protein